MNPGPLETVAVIGNGIIGHGIAQIFAAAGTKVVMIGREPRTRSTAPWTRSPPASTNSLPTG